MHKYKYNIEINNINNKDNVKINHFFYKNNCNKKTSIPEKVKTFSKEIHVFIKMSAGSKIAFLQEN